MTFIDDLKTPWIEAAFVKRRKKNPVLESELMNFWTRAEQYEETMKILAGTTTSKTFFGRLDFVAQGLSEMSDFVDKYHSILPPSVLQPAEQVRKYAELFPSLKQEMVDDFITRIESKLNGEIILSPDVSKASQVSNKYRKQFTEYVSFLNQQQIERIKNWGNVA
jgi:hypothetical protein